jgi:3-oxoacyl-[acyl-carrier-protein] synthase II
MSVVITGLGTAVAGVDGPADLVAATRVGPGADPVDRLTGRGLRYKDRATKLALCAAGDALAHAGLLREPGLAVAGDSMGVVVSSNFGNVDTIARCSRTIAEKTYAGTSPMALPGTASNVTAAALAIWYGLRGANLTLCDGAASGLDAVHWARLLVRSGRVERVLVVGVEPNNDAVRHFVESSNVDSSWLLDGAGALIVESAEAAAARGAAGYATIGPYARAGDDESAVAAVRRALPGPVGLFCPPEDVGQATVDATARQNLGAVLGRCSGALGVLQCVAGTAWLDAGGVGLVLAGAGCAPRDDACAALILSPPAPSPRNQS